MKISLITPTYNRAHTLPTLANTIFDQTNENWHWIIVDDGSTDNTEELIDSWPQDKITYIYQNNAGPSAARNKALENIQTDWIAYIDSDNELAINFVERILVNINTSPQALYFLPIAHRTKEFYENNKLIKSIDETENYSKELNILDIAHRHIKYDGNGFVHSRKVIEEGIKWDESLWMIEDFDFILSIAAKFPDNFKNIPEVLLNYHFKFGTDSLVSNAKMMEHANAFEYVYQKHKDDILMKVPGQTWYPSQVEKYRRKAIENGEII
jgi:glycosyltransferase involved in cell wall biosynthesis